MYIYPFNKFDGEVTIKTPKVANFSDIKKDIKSTEFCVINHSIYPNGLDVTINQLYDKIVISSNKKLFKNEDGSYSFED